MMIKRLLSAMSRWFFLILCPVLAHAENGAGSALSFAPPPGDYSVVFLGDIFGVVDGVLHGNGSQIMGNMFAVFNAAVLALGGIVIMYTLIVGTMNTAHEGEMLGKKWSSIWIPLRSTMGLALLIPKASGYCLMQVFVMWIVVQGVGAADKVWNAALSYLNRGGVIIQAQSDAAWSSNVDSTALSEISNGAYVILSGQVCMLGIQQQLENQQKALQSSASKGVGVCASNQSGNSGDPQAMLCNGSVPDFLGTVNAISFQSEHPSSKSPYTMKMPNFDSGSDYASLNGVCGTLSWKPLDLTGVSITGTESSKKTVAISENEYDVASNSRAIAIQQMYVELANVARMMVNNDPQINTSTGTSASSTPFSPIASSQFGIPYLNSGLPCSSYDPNCIAWGSDTSSNTQTLFNGTEFQGAVADYNGVMMPTLNLMNDAQSASVKNDARAFIAKSESQGWMLAGSYFFDLVKLNGSATDQRNQIDTSSGLKNSIFLTNTMLESFSSGNCVGEYALLCYLFGKSPTPVQQVVTLIDGSGLTKVTSPPNVSQDAQNATNSVQTGTASSTVFGYIGNAAILQLPDQPGLKAPKFVPHIQVGPPSGMSKLPQGNFNCGRKILGVCIMREISEGVYNYVVLPIFNYVFDAINKVFNAIIMNFLSIPLTVIAGILDQGVHYIQQPGRNPIVALAKMGTGYINYTMQLWMQLIEMTFISLLFPGTIVVLMIILPLLFSWLGVMVGIGFVTAYYIPFLPYMIFTFGVFSWLLAVIEAMVAAPIVALGITHPEGEGILGKGEQALMILLNVFLRPTMMIFGFITGIAMCYVGVWIINSGYSHVAEFFSGKTGARSGYTNWASVYAGFFVLVTYTMLYITLVEKSFTLIHILPDKILRWIGGSPEQSELGQWIEQLKSQSKESGKEVEKGGAAAVSKLKAGTEKVVTSGVEKLSPQKPGIGFGPGSSPPGGGGGE